MTWALCRDLNQKAKLARKRDLPEDGGGCHVMALLYDAHPGRGVKKRNLFLLYQKKLHTTLHGTTHGLAWPDVSTVHHPVAD